MRRLPSAHATGVFRHRQRLPGGRAGPDGAIWVAFVAYTERRQPRHGGGRKDDFRSFVPPGNGDQIRLVQFDGRQWSAPLAVTEALLDLWKPTVAVDGAGKVWVAWSQNVDGNWDIYRRSYDPAAAQWSAGRADDHRAGRRHQRRLRDRRERQRVVGLAGARGKHFQIFLASRTRAHADRRDRQAGQSLGPGHRRRLQGNVYVAWDSYENGNYDVFMRRVPRRASRSR